MDPLLLRFLERLTVILIGGMTIYLGFRLFMVVPEQKDSTGKVILPWDISIILTRIGPGVFFALFGVVAVGLSLVKPLEIDVKSHTATETLNSTVRYAASPEPVDRKTNADSRALLRREIATLNTIPNLLSKDLAKHERDSVERSLRRTKLALLKPAWGSPDEGFIDYSTFERWALSEETGPPPQNTEAALELYRYGSKVPTP